jgi:hypothetical protein
LRDVWTSRQRHGSQPARVTRVRLSAERNRYLRAGMTGSLCTAPNECFGSWTVIAADGSSLLLEIRMNAAAVPRSKS